MKRIFPRELLFVSAPLVVIGLGLWGARLREHYRPTRPRIDVCRVRPAMPLELYRGKQIGVTVEAVAPKTFLKGYVPGIRYSVVGRPRPQSKILEDSSTAGRGDFYYAEQQHAYTWEEFSSLPSPRIAEVKLVTGDPLVTLAKRRFELSTEGLVLPDVTTARTANFRVAKAQLRCANPSQQSEIIFDVEDIREEN